MHHFYAIARRLTAFCCVLLFACFSHPAWACSYGTYAAAMSQCQGQVAGYQQAQPTATWTCVAGIAGPGGSLVVEVFKNGAAYSGGIAYCPGDPSNPCSSLPSSSVNVSFTSQASLGRSGATWTMDPSTGAKVQCPYTISYANYSALSDSAGNFHVQATLNYTGNPSGSESSTPTAGTSVYNDASGNPLNPQPSSDGGSSPELCGGTSCADPSSGNVCALVGGAQVCQTFPPWTPNMAGGCSGGSTGAICAGSPSAPSPSAGQGGVVDPSTQIAGSDHYTSMNMGTGQVSTVVVNTFSAAPGQTVANGAKSGAQSAANSSGSSQPASSSTAGGSGYGSGGDCSSPPVCSGDAVMCGIGRQEWYAMCSAHTDAQSLSTALVGNGQQPPTFGSDQTRYSQGSVWVQPSSGNTQGDQANQGTYNTSGFGFARQCPIQDFSFKAIAVVAPFSQGCDVLQYVGPICVGLALFAAACITAGSNR